ncbi:MAG: hypothetical protein OD815_000852 [Candidatus Alkanophagales archaeon MCA70_species_2]|nr:hypothetical protein [Candidatus Alkanophaga liquidiphilum]
MFNSAKKKDAQSIKKNANTQVLLASLEEIGTRYERLTQYLL